MATDEQTKRTRNKVIVTFVIFLVAIVATPHFGLYAKIAEFKETRDDRIDTEKDLVDKAKKVETLESLRKRVEEAQDQIAYYERRLPNSPEAPELFEQLKRVANHTGVTYTGLDRIPPVEHKMYTEIPLKIHLIADYHGLGKFVNSIENSPRFAKVDNINIEINEEDYNRQKVELELSTFIFTEPVEWVDETEVTSVSGTRSVR